MSGFETKPGVRIPTQKDHLPKRFYKTASAEPQDGGFVLKLDGRTARTPGRNPMVVADGAVAEALAAEWAAQGERIDDAMGMLKELDQYLSPDEAGPLQEVARGVIGKSRDNLGVRFKLMVQDHQWGSAVEVGEQIIAEFPNTKMAQEVRQLVPVLRERAAKVG